MGFSPAARSSASCAIAADASPVPAASIIPQAVRSSGVPAQASTASGWSGTRRCSAGVAAASLASA